MASLSADRLTRLHPAAIVAIAVVGALVVNLAIWLIGLAAGGSFEFDNNGKIQSAAPGGVIVLSTVPLTIGLAIAVLLAAKWRVFIRIGQIVGALAALGTTANTFAVDFDATSTISLALMHVVVAVVAVAALEAVRKRWA